MARKIVITGAGGTVGKALKQHLSQEFDLEVVSWNRHETPLDNFAAVRQFLQSEQPDLVYNFAVAGDTPNSYKINAELPLVLQQCARDLSAKLIHTSSVMVFSDSTEGPFFPEDKPDRPEGYGWEKRMAESSLQQNLASTIIVRLGWQISFFQGGNHMVSYLENASKTGPVSISGAWYPSCSFLQDTVAQLWRLRDHQPGLYQINSNDGLSFWEIASALKTRLGATHWNLIRDDAHQGNQLMIDHRLKTPTLFPSPNE